MTQSELQSESDCSFFLLELDGGLLEKLEKGNLSIKGSANDEIILVSSNSTYQLKQVQTSNSILLLSKDESLLPHLTADVYLKGEEHPANYRVAFNGNCYLEVSIRLGLVDTVRQIFQSAHCFNNSLIGGLSVELLDERVQASRDEIEMACKKLFVFPITTPSGKFLFKVSMDLLIACGKVLFEQFLLNGQDSSQVLNTVKAENLLNQEIVEFLYQNEFFPDGKFSLSAICKAVARDLFHKQHQWQISHLLKEIEEELSFVASVSIEMIQDICVKSSSDQSQVHYLDELHLSLDPMVRVMELFRVKPKWQQSEIFPFLHSVVSHESEAGALLSKVCRSFLNSEGVRCYTLRPANSILA